MAAFTAKDVQSLRQATGAGMLDAKKALEASDGDREQAVKWLREKGLAKAASRAGRENAQGAVAVAVHGSAAALVELKCETDFVAKSDRFIAHAQELADLVAAKGEGAPTERAEAIDDLRITLKENVELGRVARIEAADDHVLDTYVHRQEGRGVNGVAIELSGGDAQLAHDVAVHAAFTKPAYVRRDQVPEADVAEERATLERISRAEGKPEAALPKIIEGRLNGWYAERVLVDQKFVRDEKQTVGGLLGDVEVVQFAQIVIGS